MSRPPCCRRIAHLPPHDRFEPSGVPARSIRCLHLGLDAWEALRLADLERLSQEDAAGHMGVSRQTFGRILEIARGTVARALVEGHGLHIEGGPVCPPFHPGWRCPGSAEPGVRVPDDCPHLRGNPSVGYPLTDPTQADGTPHPAAPSTRKE
ncbi:MAG: DUF134 domain-containing protein [Deltaproteobacteria bacterium]|nr:DUF134 domain-containing protein [Deltaproteobacteria bacterium]